ncbi:MAG: hypothetical protein ACRDK2_05365, partial [Solirubrobacteraceae bacterium]
MSISAWLLNGGFDKTLQSVGKSTGLSTQQPALHLPKTPQLHLPSIHTPQTPSAGGLENSLTEGLHILWTGLPLAGVPLAQLLVVILLLGGCVIGSSRLIARHRRVYVRLRVDPYRTDRATVQGIVSMFEALHKRLLRRWWRRLFIGQPSVAVEVHLMPRLAGRVNGAQGVES